MIIKIEIPDDAIEEENYITEEDIINIIENGTYYMFRVRNYHHIADSNIKYSIL